ncbi:MAG TPA: PQQ-binding-like beta-propeller repeat protein [Vicinamibacterales bacterium]|nr:PQQ-binding-like beta-propeller repeat protein [Vicinamibacterales bacterium]
MADPRRLRHLAPATVLALCAGVVLAAQSSTSSLPAVFTAADASRGKDVYTRECASCHGGRLQDGTAIALVGRSFLQKWSHPLVTLDDLFYVVQNTMPKNRGNALAAEDYAAVVAYLMEQNGYPAGAQSQLATQQLRRNVRLTDSVSAEAAPEFIAGSSGSRPAAASPNQTELSAAATNGSAWLYHTQNYHGTRASPAAQITPANAGRLQVVCAFQLGEASNFQTGPLVYDGVMYVTTVHVTAAIDATTCQLKWRHVWTPRAGDVWRINRGVGLKDGRVYRGTSDGYLVALDASNGRMLWARKVADAISGETLTMPPMLFEDIVIIGPAGSENGIKGWVGAFRAEDGQPVWRFNIVPRKGEHGFETWKADANIPLGGGAVWTPVSLDAARGHLFVAASNPSPDFPSALRGDSNLYTNTLLVLDVRTGKTVWYDQIVPQDGHDWDLTQVSPLIRTSFNGRPRDLVITSGKDGMLRAVDRDTRERVYETAVTTRSNVDAPVTQAGTHVCPGVFGGVSWNGPAFNARTNLLYVPVVDWCGTFTLTNDVRFVPGAPYMGGSYTADSTSQGWVTALDASSGEVKWRYRSRRPIVAAVTTSDGGVVMTGELTGDFLVLDAANGHELYRFNTGGPIGAGIVTYEIAGRQYVAVASGSPSSFWIESSPGTPTVFVFALPRP